MRTEDDALAARLDADAQALDADTAAITAALASAEGRRKVAAFAATLLAEFEPLIVSSARGAGGPLAGAGAQLLGDAVVSEVQALAAKK